jgi:hypothetical protein
LKDGKLRESEAFFETALASQNERVQPVALYNLGHVRFGQGVEQLKKGPPGKTTMAAGASAGQSATGAIQEANKALAGDDMQSLIAAYMRGRGARKELKAASEAVRRAVEAFGAALSKWQRASGDFKGAVELNPADDDAKQNADIVDRNIAKLVDSLREMESMANAMGNQKQELGEKLKELKGRIPAPNMPPGAAGDDDEEEDKPNGPKEGDKEGPTKEGQEMSLSPEQAGWLLDGFKLGGDHRLPMGQGDPGDPRKRNRPTW